MRRLLLPLLAAFLTMAASVQAQQSTPPQSFAGQVFKSPSCDCCSKWMAHMAKNGIALEEKVMANKDLHRFKVHVGLRPDQAACHTATIDGYIIEGHVPADDVKRLLAETPDAIGLSVPGMPIGSPGMEMEGRKDPYDVLLIKKDGTTEVWAKR
jgi:hypothetical protein